MMTPNNNISEGCSCCKTCAETTLETQAKETAVCSCGSNCCGASKLQNKSLVIDFLYLDLSTCTRCRGTDESLDEALAEASKVLEASGVEVTVNKINVTSEELAVKHQFVSSPTIRVNGRDIQMDVKESLCESCGDLCGDEVDCRIWVYQGVEYPVAPKAMIVEAILKEAKKENGTVQSAQEYSVPENLKRYYAGFDEKNKDQKAEESCCSSPASKCCV